MSNANDGSGHQTDGADSSTSPSDAQNERARELEQQVQQLQKENLALTGKIEQIDVLTFTQFYF